MKFLLFNGNMMIMRTINELARRRHTNKSHHKLCLTCNILGFFICLNSASAEGFRNPPPGAFNLGRAGGRIAHVQDASAVTHNPANLVELTNYEAQAVLGVVYISADYTAPNGQTATTENPWKALPAAYFTTPLFDDTWAFGLGITSPYGLGVDWDERNSSAFAPATPTSPVPGSLRYTSPHFAELMTINLNPTVSIKLTEKISLGIGLDVMWSRLTLQQFYPWAIFPGSGGTEPDGDLHAQGDGFGYGGNIGFTWKITPRQTLAVTYRSQMDVDYDGDATLSNITPTAAGFGITSQNPFSSSIAFPNIVSVGYGLQVTDKLRLETDVEWVQFSRFKSLPISAGTINNIVPPSVLNTQENWRDTFTFGIAGDYQLSERWTIRGGYQYYQSPVPDSTFSTTIPDADQNVITVGLAYHTGPHTVEFAYGADFYDTRDISGSSGTDGKYKITVHLFSLSYRLTF